MFEMDVTNEMQARKIDWMINWKANKNGSIVIQSSELIICFETNSIVQVIQVKRSR